MLLSQMSSQKWDQCSALALPCVDPWSCEPGLATVPGLGIQTQPFLMLTSGLWFPLCLPPHTALPQGSTSVSDQEVWQHKSWAVQRSCSQRTLLTMCCALIQHNQAHHLHFQKPTEHLINYKWSHPPPCVVKALFGLSLVQGDNLQIKDSPWVLAPPAPPEVLSSQGCPASGHKEHHHIYCSVARSLGDRICISLPHTERCSAPQSLKQRQEEN